MSDQEEKIQKLVRLKRHETPRDGYFEDFLEEFQKRQRSELLHRSSVSIFLERLGTWFREIGSVKWVAGAGAAYAALMIGILLWPRQSGNSDLPTMSPASFEPEAPVNPTPVPKTKDKVIPVPGKDF